MRMKMMILLTTKKRYRWFRIYYDSEDFDTNDILNDEDSYNDES